MTISHVACRDLYCFHTVSYMLLFDYDIRPSLSLTKALFACNQWLFALLFRQNIGRIVIIELDIYQYLWLAFELTSYQVLLEVG